MRSPRVGVVAVALLVVVAACTSSGDTASTGVGTSSTVPGLGTPPGDAALAPPPPPPPIVPLLRRSGPHGDAQVGQRLQLTGEAFAAAPVARLELWVDGQLVEQEVFDDPVVDPTFVWWWTPTEAGLHAALVRAYDAEGRSAGSYPTWVRAHPVEGLPPFNGRSPADADMTPPASLAISVDEQGCSATIAVPPSPASAGHTVGGATLGMAGFAALAVLGPGGGDVTVPLADTPVVVVVESYDTTMATPLPLGMLPGVDGCAGGRWSGDVGFVGTTLVGHEDVDRAYLYATVDGHHWDRYPSGDGSFVDRGPGGFDFSGLLPHPEPGAALDVEVWGWRGDRLVGLGRAVFDPWTPPPPPPGEPGPVFGPLQAAPPTGTLTIVRTVSTGPIEAPTPTEVLSFDTVVCAEGVSNILTCQPDPIRLRWTMSPISVPEDGLLQVSRVPPPSGPAISFPGMLAATKVATDGVSVRDIEFVAASVLGEGGDLVGGAPQQIDFPQLDALSYQLSAPTSTPGPGELARTSDTLLIPFLDPPPGPSSDSILISIAELPPTKLWVRILPFIDGKPVEGTTNPVTLTIEYESFSLAAPESALVADVGISGRFFRPSAGSSQFFRCVRVVENPFGDQNPIPDYLAGSPGEATWTNHYNGFRDSAKLFGPGGFQQVGMVEGATVCAYHPKPPSKGPLDHLAAAVEFVAGVWDMYVDLLDMMKSGIINGIVDLTGCEPKATCAAALTALADVGLAAIGVPPSLPSFNQLVEAAKGDLTTLVSAVAVDAVGCGAAQSICEEWAEDFVADVLDQIQAHVSDMTVAQVSTGGWVLSLHPDIEVVPEPAGHFFPGAIEITLTRPEGVVVPAGTCTVSFEITGSGPVNWTDAKGHYHDDEIVSGVVFPKVWTVVDPSSIPPGGAKTLAISLLDFERHTYLPGASFFDFGSQSKADYHLVSLSLWRRPTTVHTMTAEVCGQQFVETFQLDGIAKDPAAFPTP